MSPMTPWFLAGCLGRRWEEHNFSSSFLIPTFLSIIKYSPLILGMQTLKLRENRSVAPKPHKSGTSRTSTGIAIHAVWLQCPLSSPHYAAWQTPWAMRSEEGAPESSCDFFAV